MSRSEFDLLPWFIRNRIIMMVVLIQPHYSVIGSEWVVTLLSQFGIILYSQSEPNDRSKDSKFTKFYTNYAKCLYFNRLHSINWNQINFTSTKEIIINTPIPSPYRNDKDFIDNFNNFTDITSLSICTSGDESGLEYYLMKYGSRLKKLEVTSLWSKRGGGGLSLSKFNLINLVELNLNYLPDTDYLKNFNSFTPRLKSLKLKLIGLKFSSFSPSDIRLPDLIEFSLSYQPQIREPPMKPLELDLTNFTNLKKLTLMGEIKLIPSYPPNNLIQQLYLDLNEPHQYHLTTLSCQFPNLSFLYLHLKSNLNNNLLKLLKSSTQLTTLKLYTNLELRLDPNLVSQQLPITSLQLGGQLVSNPAYLDWFLNLLPNLHRLDMDYLHTNLNDHLITNSPSLLLPNLPPTLHHLTLAIRPYYQKYCQSHFLNQRNYPHLHSLDLVKNYESNFIEDARLRVNLLPR